MSSAKKFNENRKAVIAKVAEIMAAVERLDDRTHKGADADWADAGDLGMIAAGLEDILATARTMK